MRRGKVCAVLLALVALLCAAPAASAATVTDRPLLATCDGSGATAGAFKEVRDLEVEQESGDLYVYDFGHSVIDKLDAGCVPREFAASGESSLPVPRPLENTGEPALAIDNSGLNPGRLFAVRGEAGTELLSAFAPTGTPLWQREGGLGAPCALAVDPEGHLWVMDSFYLSRGAVELASSGSPPAQIGEFPYTNAGKHPCSLDFDAAGNAYVASSREGGGVFRYAKNGAGEYKPESALDPEESAGVAVDRSDGHVFASHGEYFSEYDAAGNPVGAGSFGKGVLSAANGIAVNEAGAGGVPAGTVYVANLSGPKVYAFGPEATGTVPDVEAEAAGEIEVSRAKLHGKVKPNSVPNAYFFEWVRSSYYGESWGEAESSPSQSLNEDNGEYPVSFNVNHLAGNTTYQVRLVGIGEHGLRQVSDPVPFTTLKASEPPGVTIDPVEAEATPPCTTGITAEGACVSGSVNPREDFSTTWWLETSTAPSSEPEKCFPSFSKGPIHRLESEAESPVEVHEDLSGLFPSQDYCVRIAAENSFNRGSPTTSAIERFETDPVPPDQVVTGFAAPRTTTSARLNAYANPEGEVMSYRFEYRKDDGEPWIPLKDHEDTSEARHPILLSSTEAVGGQLTEELTELSPATTYSFRFSARNHCHPNTEPEAWCTAEGETKTFTTRTQAEAEEVDPPSCPNEEVRQNRRFSYLPQCRGIELVNNPEDGNQNVRAETGQGTPPLSPDGERALWNVNGGAPGANSGVGATFLARRTGPSEAAPNGWTSCSLIPPAAQQIHGEDGSYEIQAATPGLTRFLFLPGVSALGGQFTETLVRLGECGQGQEALKAYDGPQVTSNSDMSADGAHVLHIDYDVEEEHLKADQLEDIGTPGHPEVLSYLPDGSLPECGVEDEGQGFSGAGPVGAGVQWRPGYKRMGAEGSRVYFQIHPNGSDCGNTLGPWQILERDREANGGAGETLEVAPPDPKNALIRATPDGRSVYFASALALDPAHPGVEGVNAYRWQEAPDGLSGTDTCLTCAIENEAGEAIAGANLRTFGEKATPVLVSDDFSHLYFESTAKLSPQATPGRANLYALSLGDRKLRFVATPAGSASALEPDNAELSADGEALVFETPAGGRPELTADRLAASCPDFGTSGSEPCTELFRYDDRDRSLECLSCLHDAVTTASVGVKRASSNDFRMAADGGTVAFVTAQALAPSLDINRGSDLYEWRYGERLLITDGEGDFGQSGPTVTLQPYALSATGRDILFRVLAPGLTGFETTRLANLYDARIGGGFEVPPPPEGCTEESCQGPLVAPPPFGQPGSTGFSGAGNLEAAKPRRCRHGKLRRRGRCIARHRHHRRGHKHHRRHRRAAANGGRAR